MRASARTQSSIAVSPNGIDWVLFNASPDIRTQLERFPEVHPRRGIRDSGIRAVVLIDSQIDHTTGLLMLRESAIPLSIYCTEMVYADLTSGFPVLSMLQHYCRITRFQVPLDGSPFSIDGITDLSFTAHALKSKAPPYSPHRHDPHPGDNIGVVVKQLSTQKQLYYAPGLGEIETQVDQAMRAADCLLVDGTFWREDEMSRAGISDKRARDMGHLPQAESDGMIQALKQHDRPRKILIHINNTNPILDEDSAERRELASHGIEVAYDGMEIEL